MIRSAFLGVTVFLTLVASAGTREMLVAGAEPTTATNHRLHPSSASDGDGFFTVWTDYRSSPGAGSVIGTRVTRDGRILDPYGIHVATTTGWIADPQVVWDGGAYLVVWGATDRVQYSQDLYAARITRDGGYAMTPRVVADDVALDSGRYLASNGNVSVALYRDGGLRALALDREGNVLHDEQLPALDDNIRHPAVAAGASRFVVAWNANSGFSPDGDTIKAVTLTAAGHVSGAVVQVSEGEHPAIGTDGTVFTITSRRNRDWAEYELLSRTVDASLTPIGQMHSLLVTRRLAETAAVLWIGNRFEIVTMRQGSATSGNELISFELDRNGVPQPPVRSRGPATGELLWLRMGVATNGTDVFLARPAEGVPNADTQIFGQMYQPVTLQTATPPALLSWSGNVHRQPDIASNGFGHFIVWTEDAGVYGTRIDANGVSLDGRGIRLAGPDLSYVARARVAFDGTNYVIAWMELDAVGVRYVAPHSGATVAEARIPATGWPSIALATSPEATYVVRADTRIWVTRIPHTTYVPEPVPLAVSPDEMSVDYPEAAWNGSELLVVWSEQYTVPRADPPLVLSRRIFAARVTAGLTLLDPSPLHIGPDSAEEDYETFDPPSVVSNGADWLVVSSRNGEQVVARRVRGNGMLDGNELVPIGNGQHPVAAWDGTRYVIAWKEGTDPDAARPLVLNTISASGELAVMQRAFVANDVAASRPAIVSTGNGEASIAYTKLSFRFEHAGVERSFFRVLDRNNLRGRVVRR